MLTAQHFFIGQIQILNTSLKWQHRLNPILTPPHRRLLMISGHCFLIKTLSHMSPAWSPALDTPMWSNQRLCYQDVFRRSQSLSGHMRGITHILVTSGCRLGEMLLLMIRGTIGQQFPDQYPANFVIYPRYICGLGHHGPPHLSQSLP